MSTASTPVEHLMTRVVVACKPGDDVREAERLMGVSLVHVGHPEHGLLNARQSRHIDELEQAAVAPHLREETFVSKDAGRNAHFMALVHGHVIDKRAGTARLGRPQHSIGQPRDDTEPHVTTLVAPSTTAA